MPIVLFGFKHIRAEKEQGALPVHQILIKCADLTLIVHAVYLKLLTTHFPVRFLGLILTIRVDLIPLHVNQQITVAVEIAGAEFL